MATKNGYYSKTVLGNTNFLDAPQLPKRDIFGAYFTVKPQRTGLEERPIEELALLTKLDGILVSGDSTVRITNLAVSFEDPNILVALQDKHPIQPDRSNHFVSFIEKLKDQLNDEFDTVFFSEFEAALFYECLLYQKLKFTFVSTRD